MNIILSRKGFDSSSGGLNSIIINNKFYSFPIPDKFDINKHFNNYKEIYDEYFFPNEIREIIGKHKFRKKSEGIIKYYLFSKYFDRMLEGISFHFDPFIYSDNEYNLGLLGQINGSPQYNINYLSKNNIKEGDLFLFFGLFTDDLHHINRLNQGFHTIYSFMKIDKIIDLVDEDELNEFKKSDDFKKYFSEKTRLFFLHNPHVLFQDSYKKFNGHKLYLSYKKDNTGNFDFSEDFVLTNRTINSWSKSNWKKEIVINNGLLNLKINLCNNNRNLVEREKDNISYIDANKRFQELIICGD